MDIFECQLVSPMMVCEKSKPFDDSKFLYEVKHEGGRCLAYLDADGTRLVNGECAQITEKFPELSSLHRQVSGRCILDGELIVPVRSGHGRKMFLKRAGMSSSFMIKMASKVMPAVFMAFDILYHHGEQITQFPLIVRKRLLGRIVRESNRIMVSRYVEETGLALFEAIKAQKLNGIVAKKKNAPYRIGEQTKDWITIKNLRENDFVICGYVPQGRKITCLLLGQYSSYGKERRLLYKGYVKVGGMSRHDTHVITRQKETGECLLINDPALQNSEIAWVMPHLVCTVQYESVNVKGLLEGAEFLSLRVDKAPYEATEYTRLAFA